MEVRPGYKQTEMGFIPEDWEMKRWGEVISRCSGGATPRRNRPEFYNGDIRWITSGELDYNVITDTAEKISHDAVIKSNLAMVPTGTFLMAITGLEAEGTRGACGIVGAPSTTNQSCMAVFPTEALVTEYLFHYYVFRGKQLALQYCQGTKQQSYTAGLVKQLPILLPPTTTEQRAIAEALSDVDALLGGMDRLIAKKRDLKQAALQQLLTGRIRLPGFRGEWEVKALGEIAAFHKGRGLPKSALTPYGSESCVHYGELFTHYGETICETISRTNKSPGEFYSVANDVLMPTSDVTPRGLAKASCVVIDGVVLGGDILVIRTAPSLVSGTFLSHVIRVEDDQVLRLVTGTTVYHLYGADMKKFTFKLPRLAEQQAIVAVLSDIDAELTALEARRDKTRDLKQAVMQELLTGKTRLIPAGAANA